MKLPLRLLLLLLFAGLAGCQHLLPAAVTDYYAGDGENPLILALHRDGTYSWGRPREDRPDRMEQGRWWRLDPVIVVLLPSDPASSQWFARTERPGPNGSLRCSTRLHDLIQE